MEVKEPKEFINQRKDEQMKKVITCEMTNKTALPLLVIARRRML